MRSTRTAQRRSAQACAAGIGQNGYIDVGTIKNGPSNSWHEILNIPRGDAVSKFRTFIDLSDKKYNTIVLKKYAVDLRALYWLGWELPEGMNNDEFEQYLSEITDLANGK